MESIFTLPFMEDRFFTGNEDVSSHDGLTIGLALQETLSPEAVLNLVSPDSDDDFRIALCRFYECSIRAGRLDRTWQSIWDRFSAAVVERGLRAATYHVHSELLTQLSSLEFYQSEPAWRTLFADPRRLTNDCADILNRYFHWWHLGEGQMPPSATGSLASAEWQRFDALTPIIYLSLHVLHRLAPGCAPIERLATSVPNHTPRFDGVDIWIQRKAVVMMAETKGISFLTEGLRKPDSGARLTAIYYALLQPAIPDFDLRLVKREAEAILSRNSVPEGINDVELDLRHIFEDRSSRDITALIDRRLQSSAG